MFQAHRRTDRARRADLKRAGLRVQSVDGGWIPAAEARFGKGWPAGTLGPDLADFLAIAGDHEEMVGLRARTLAPYDGRRFRGGDQEEWATFLNSAGVGYGLAPDDLTGRSLTLPKWRFKPKELTEYLHLSGDDAAGWMAEIRHAPEPGRRSPWTIKSSVYRIPGQGAYSSLTSDARHRFALLLLDGLPAWPADLATFRVEGEVWPSPAGSFLRNAAWLPVGRPGEKTARWSQPGRAWHYIDDDGGSPAYADLLDQRIRRRLNGSELLWARVRSLGVHEWGDPGSAIDRLATLVRLAQGSNVSEVQRGHIRRAYERSWGHVVAMRPAPSLGASGPPLLVTVKGRLGVLDHDRRIGKIYVLATPDPLTEAMVDARRVARLRIEPRDAAAAKPILDAALGDRLVFLQRGSVTVSLDGQLVRARESDPVLVNAQRGWLAELLTLTLDLVLRTEVTTQSTAKAVGRLRRIRLRYGTSISVSVPNTSLDDPGGAVTVVPVDHDRWPTVVLAVPEGSAGKTLRWPQLEAIGPAIAELVGLPSADVPLRFAISKLAAGSPGPVTAPDVDQYAAALGVRVDQVRDTLTANRDLLDRVAFVLRPVIACWFGRAPRGRSRPLATSPSRTTTSWRSSRSWTCRASGRRKTCSPRRSRPRRRSTSGRPLASRLRPSTRPSRRSAAPTSRPPRGPARGRVRPVARRPPGGHAQVAPGRCPAGVRRRRRPGLVPAGRCGARTGAGPGSRAAFRRDSAAGARSRVA